MAGQRDQMRAYSPAVSVSESRELVSWPIGQGTQKRWVLTRVTGLSMPLPRMRPSSPLMWRVSASTCWRIRRNGSRLRWTNISKLSQLCCETIKGRAPLAKAASWTGMSGKACLTPSLLDCCMRPASTSSPDAPSVDPGEPERIRSSDRRQHRANTAFNFVLNQDYQRLSRSCRTERPPTQKTGRIPQRLERLAGSSRFQNESTADRVVLKVKIESFSKCRNQQTQALSRVVFKVSPHSRASAWQALS
ncbi:hypothetical protein V1278_002206 [Bradyrhizobium sp. AZCC 1577]